MKATRKPFTKKYSAEPCQGGWVLCNYGERTGQIYATQEECQQEVDKLYPPKKTTPKATPENE